MRRFFGIAMIGALLSAAAVTAQNSDALSSPSVSRPAATAEADTTPPELVSSDIGAWLDGYMGSTLGPGKLAGAQIVVVKDGQVLLKRGYGYADVAAKTAMDPDRTLMRIGSTSKLFTWTAVMQLVEAGKIDLDADINQYLDFKIAAPSGHRVTMNDLMTHRGGFEEGLKDVMATDPARFKSTERYLKENQRPFMFVPGEVPAYSNYGTALAGYIVQRVSGEPYDAYIERHILAPLHMLNTTSRQPLPARWRATMSKGYRTSDTAPSPFELVVTAPAGAISATGADMANFMIAHLDDGRFGERAVLQPATARFMHTPNHQPMSGFAALAHGFFRSVHNGRVVLGHGGDTVVFHSDLNLLPEERVGIFVSFNSRGENDAVYSARERLFEAFMDRYYPVSQAKTAPAIASARDDARAIAGNYESSRRVETGFISLFYLLLQERVTANDDGTISLSSAPDANFREVAPGLWREVDGERQLFAPPGKRRVILDSENPIAILQAAPFGRSSTLFQFIAGLSLLIMLATLAKWPVAAWLQHRRALPAAAAGRASLVRRLTRIAVVADLAYLAGWYAMVAPILQSDVSFYNGGLDAIIRLLQVAAIVPVLGALIGIMNVQTTFRHATGWALRICAVLVALALTGFLWTAWMSGFMSWTLNY